jgi:hypothetical protein
MGILFIWRTVEFVRLGGCEIWAGFGKDKLPEIRNLLDFSE